MTTTERRYADQYRAGRIAWPGVELDEDAFERHLAAITQGASPPASEVAADLYLACACARGVPSAIRAFEQAYGEILRHAVRRVEANPSFVADAVQGLRERLLVGQPDAPPKIAGYTGGASLRTWISVAAVRLAINMRKRKSESQHAELKSTTGVIADAVGPELAILRDRYKPGFEDALRSAIASLPAADRALLRLHVVERMTVDQLGAVYRVGRSTAARRVAAAREALRAETRRIFCEGARVTESEFVSIARVLEEDLEVSIEARLAQA